VETGLITRTNSCVVGDHILHDGMARPLSQEMQGLLVLLAHITRTDSCVICDRI